MSQTDMLSFLNYDYSAEDKYKTTCRRKPGFENEFRFVVDLFNRAFMCVAAGRDQLRNDTVTLTYWFFQQDHDVHLGNLLYSIIANRMDNGLFGRLICRIMYAACPSVFDGRPTVPIPDDRIMGLISHDGTIGKVCVRKGVTISLVKSKQSPAKETAASPAQKSSSSLAKAKGKAVVRVLELNVSPHISPVSTPSLEQLPTQQPDDIDEINAEIAAMEAKSTEPAYDYTKDTTFEGLEPLLDEAGRCFL